MGCKVEVIPVMAESKRAGFPLKKHLCETKSAEKATRNWLERARERVERRHKASEGKLCTYTSSSTNPFSTFQRLLLLRALDIKSKGLRWKERLSRTLYCSAPIPQISSLASYFSFG
jgi:hypothetical protein